MTEKAFDQEGFDYYQRLSVKQTGILQTLIDISRIITTSHDLEETLAQTVSLIAERVGVDVCSIYLLDEKGRRLELRATRGLDPSAVGKVRMKVTEGLIGLVMEQKHPVNVRDVASHPRFKYFPKIKEEHLSSFLGIPLIEHRKSLGVLVIQNLESRLFSSDEENMLVTIASQISGLISKVVLVDRIQREAERAPPTKRKSKSFRLEGTPIAPGLVKEKVFVLKRHRIEEPEYKSTTTPEQEKKALRVAVEASVGEILKLIDDVSSRLGEEDAAIFHAHLLFLEDRSFINKILGHIESGAGAIWAVSHVIREHLEAFQNIDDPYLRERGADLEDVGFRLLQHLGGSQRRRMTMERPGVLVADMITPSDSAELDPEMVKGIVTTYGGYLSHAAILARSLRIPAVTKVADSTEVLKDGDEVLVDGETGVVFVNPEKKILREYDRHLESHKAYISHLEDLREVPCVTKDGHRISLQGNVGLMQDLKDLTEYGAEGIGLYRSEVYYMMRSSRPSLEELVETYTQVIKAAQGKPVIFRTLDVGGDTFPGYLQFPKEENPLMGMRSIRYGLRRQSLLTEQLKAVLKVAGLGKVQLMFPLISQLEELHELKKILSDCRRELEEAGEGPVGEVELGMLFEVPAAVLKCELFIGEIDFMCIGSNDLTQYTLAVDRNNPNINHLYDPLDPAVLMMIQRLIDSAGKHDKPIKLCGEMSSDPEGCLVLVGMGIREMSMNPTLVPVVKDRISRFTLAELKQLAGIALTSTTAESVRRNIRLYIRH